MLLKVWHYNKYIMMQNKPVFFFNTKFNQMVNDLQNTTKVDIKSINKLLNYIKYDENFLINTFKKYIINDAAVYLIINEKSELFSSNILLELLPKQYHKFSLTIKEIFNCLSDINRKHLFDYFKIFIYYAYLDMNKDINVEIERINSIINCRGNTAK